MRSKAMAISLLGLALFGGSAPDAQAHPHVWVQAHAELGFAPDGRIAEVRHQWSFDEAYSAFATQGLDADKDGVLTRQELAELAKINTESLAEFGFFTLLKADGRKQDFAAPKEEWLDFKNGVLTLHFVLPLAEPVKARRAYGLEVFDPTYFVSFGFVPGDDAVKLAAAPPGCALQINRGKAPDAEQQKLSEADFSAFEGMGAQFASKVVVACP
jgi:ABC-type uncharacterized transport system substrate-binding protein